MNKILKHLGKNWYRYGLETLVVIVGVLIAFTLSNWSQKSILKEKEHNILLEIDRDLSRNILVLQNTIDTQNDVIENISYSIYQIENGKEFTSELSTRLQTIKWIEEVVFSFASFESLKVYGVDLINSDSVRSEIIQLFGFDYPQMVEWINNIGMVQYEQLSIPAFKYFKYDEEGNPIPYDYKNLVGNEDFISLLYSRRPFKMSVVSRAKRLMTKSQIVRSRVQKEIEKFNWESDLILDSLNDHQHGVQNMAVAYLPCLSAGRLESSLLFTIFTTGDPDNKCRGAASAYSATSYHPHPLWPLVVL